MTAKLGGDKARQTQMGLRRPIWKRDLKYSILDWQPIDCILAAWSLLEHEDVEPLKVTIPPEQIGFAKDNLRRCSAQERGRKVVRANI